MKTKFAVYKLHFTTPLHLGDERDDYSISLKTYQSDAMYAALTSCLAIVGKAIPESGDLGFSISSLFPYYQKEKDSKAVYFFPKLLKQKLPKLEDISKAKIIKKVSWIETAYFEKLINGTTLFETEQEIGHIQGDFLSSTVVEKDFISSQVSPRVTVSRDQSEDAKPFYMDRIYFKDKSGLFFIVHGDTNILESALNILKDEGIGTDRNIGNGFFEFEKDGIELDLPESNFVTNLSMFCPESESQLNQMLDNESVAYDFTRRGGWITTSPHNTIRKNSVHMFLPSCVFHTPIKNAEVIISGKIHDLNPRINFAGIDHPVWRNGKAIFLPVIV
ncbi:MAG TPA: type III-A CRISPR-associated RAMP protein Csm4 [Candidatus Paceibacterota bacterium]|nr:type III-A CRISPR-associated RAMP protein Csm4 [Candidatus Paceibacterota bacterium]